MDELAHFNAEQKAAILFPADKNLLISAGAGSGKTSVIAEKVYQLINKGIITPEELLVLTFTDNASYEMRTRILARFGKTHPMYQRMLSCHIQSFDSFNAYLVRLYANRLGIDSSFQILPKSIEGEKAYSYCQQALLKAYEDDDKKKKIGDLWGKIGFKNDNAILRSIIDLFSRLAKMEPKERESFYENYLDNVHGLAKENEYYDLCVKELQNDLLLMLRAAVFKFRHQQYVVEQLESGHMKTVLSQFDAVGEFVGDLRDYSFEDLPEEFAYLSPIYEALCDVLYENDPDEAITKASDVANRYSEKKKAPSKNTKDPNRPTYMAFKKDMEKAVDKLSTIKELESREVAIARDSYLMEGEEVLLTIAMEALEQFNEYKAKVGSYTFGDITSLAMSLFDGELKNEIVSRFSFVMVDEYQDTNDIQEALINHLISPCVDNEGKTKRAHLFAVGDAKQAIYAFRGSNLSLFKNRRAQYLRHEDGEVIDMNRNYRSAEKLINDINSIFSTYMRPELGGIDYLDPAERLTYDPEKNPYSEDTGEYGVHFIVPPNTVKLMKKDPTITKVEPFIYEIKAIIDDIKHKVATGFPVYDRKTKGSHIRKCRYSDFAIIVRKKSRHAPIYRSYFYDAGIPLNVLMEEDLKEARPIILLRSLLSMMACIRHGEYQNIPHYFASIARSYAYGYDDDRLYKILVGAGEVGEDRVLSAIRKDPIYQAVNQFAFDTINSSFVDIFVRLVKEFGIIEKLPSIGDISNDLAHIEALYQMAKFESSNSSGLDSFIAFFENIDLFDLNISASSRQETENAVDLMTIHGSKGLERKIVYLPSSDNGITKGDARKNPPFEYSNDLGIIFPYLDYDLPEDIDPTNDVSGSILTMRNRLLKNSGGETEEDEHVRLLYVALTRAENALYVVGEKRTSSAYLMLEKTPSSITINPKIMDLIKKHNLVQEWAINGLNNAQELLKEAVLPPYNHNGYVDKKTLNLRDKLHHDIVIDPINKLISNSLFEIYWGLYSHFKKAFLSHAEDLDELSFVFASAFYPGLGIKSKGGAFSLLEKGISGNKTKDDGADDDDEDSNIDLAITANRGLKEILLDFAKGVADDDVTKVIPHISISQVDMKSDQARKSYIIDALLNVFAKNYGKFDYVAYRKYEISDNSKTAIFDAATFEVTFSNEPPHIDGFTYDDTEIDFPLYKRERASKKATDEELPNPEILDRGTRLHRYMELVDFQNRDLEYIDDLEEKSLIAKVLTLPLFSDMDYGRIYPEYGYYDSVLDSLGFMDLVFFDKEGICHIVDYKSSNIDDPSYESQLNVYGRNALNIFKIKPEQIQLHLVSLRLCRVKDVKFDYSE